MKILGRYHFYSTPNGETICVSTFAKKKIKGVAKCSPSDTYDEETGKMLAMLRCDKKIAKKRLQRAKRELLNINSEYKTVKDRYNKIVAYFYDSVTAYEDITNRLKRVEEEL